jgi:Cu2+-exporting ATPase
VLRVEHTGSETRFAQIVTLMESASTSKPQLAQLADRVARPFLIFVLVAAGGAGAWWWSHDPGHALMVAVAVLIVTCPCALSLATPAAMLASAGALARGGVLVRRLQALETLAAVNTVVFDKTGTLTRDAFALADVHTRSGVSREDALAMAAALGRHSLHPVSRALVAAEQRTVKNAKTLLPDGWVAEQAREIAGQGVSAHLTSAFRRLPALSARLGSARFCGVDLPVTDALHACLSDDQGWVATFELREDLRPDARATVAMLAGQGVQVLLLSGDSPESVARVARQAGINEAHGSCSPQDKLAFLRELQAQGLKVAMVGDGLNDGPVLAGAHASFAFGQAVPLAQAQADFVVLGDRLGTVAETLLLARRTLGIVRQNLWWAVFYNAVCVPLAMVGWLPAWLAGLGMALSSLLVVLNALRLSTAIPPLENL